MHCLAVKALPAIRNLTYSAAIWDEDGRMIATGSLFENTLRCLAVDGAHRGEGLMADIVAHLVQVQMGRGNTHLFLYTKCDSAKFFAPLGLPRSPGWKASWSSWKTGGMVSRATCARSRRTRGNPRRSGGDECQSLHAGARLSA